MKLFGYIIESSLNSKHLFKHFKVHKRGAGIKHLVWGKLSIIFGPEQFCEACDISTGLQLNYCDDCYSHHFCECGNKLENEYGSPGDGLCRSCD